jgi:hypothetical protein
MKETREISSPFHHTRDGIAPQVQYMLVFQLQIWVLNATLMTVPDMAET